MNVMERVDQALRAFLIRFEELPNAVTRAADRALHALHQYTNTLVVFVKTTVDVLVRFLRDLLVNLSRLAWQLCKLGVVVLVPLNLLGFGVALLQEGTKTWTQIAAWSLIAAGGAGALLCAVAIVAAIPGGSYARARAKERTATESRDLRLLGFLFLDIVAIAHRSVRLPHANPALHLVARQSA